MSAPSAVRSGPEASRGGLWAYSEETYLQFEALLRKHGLEGGNAWRLRNEIFCTLTQTEPNRCIRFRFSFLGSLMKTFFLWLRAQRHSAPPLRLPVAYVLLVSGDQSKELDMARSVGAELIRRGQSVAIMHSQPGEKQSPLAAEFPEHCHLLTDEHIYRLSGWQWMASLAKVFYEMGSLLRLRRDAPGIAARVLYRGGPLFELFRDLFLAEKFFLRSLSKELLRGVAVVSEDASQPRALVLAAHQWNAPAFHFLHGFPHVQHASAESDHIFCFSSVDRVVFLSNGWPETSVHACGHCRSGIIARDIAARREAMALGGGLRILFAEQCREGRYDEECHRQTITCMLEAAVKAGLSADELRIRIHPRSDRTQILEIAQCVGFHAIENYLSSRSLADDLAWANTVATAWSTMAVEAAWAGACLIWLPVGLFVFPIRERLVESGYGIEVRDSADLAGRLEQLRKPANMQAASEKIQAAAQQLAICSPTAVEDSVSIMC